ncbi:MAG: DNA polymerase III subunit delta' [Actinomycetota bacterium]
MSVWDEVPVTDGPVSLLQRDIESRRVAHAYLFSGVAGRLPAEVALAFSAALVCADGGCGTCEACVRVQHRAHPDVEVIEPAGMQLLVEQVRDAIRAASRRPVAAPRRVIIVEGADRMNPNAQNAFLKALEEPPPSTTILLLAPSPEALLETVRSRCREVTFHSPPPEDVAALLERNGVASADARHCARVGGGLERALALATDAEARAFREELVDRVIAPFADPGEALEAAEWLAGKTREVRERVAAQHREAAAAYNEWYRETKRATEDRVRREQRRAEQDALEAVVDDVVSVLRDLIVVLRDEDGEVLNERIIDALVDRARRLRPGAEPRLIAALGEIERCRRRLRANANVLLTLESLFLAVFRFAS